MNSVADIWKIVLSRLSQDLSETTISTWFDEVEAVSIKDLTLYLHCPNDFKRSTIESMFADRIKDSLRDIYSADFDVKLLSSAESAALFTPEEKKSASLFDSSEFTFETFVVGESNKMAYAAARAVADGASDHYNPLFIYGDSGLGKTHLIYAIAHQIRSTRPSSKIIYIKGDDFINEFIELVRAGRGSEFRAKYRDADLLLVDDVQFVAGKEQVQNEFFHTFNDLYNKGKQIIVSSDRPPKELPTLEERIRSRFSMGLIVDIQKPDFETRVAIVKRKAELLNLDLPNDVAEYIANHLKQNIRQLEGAVKKLNAYYLLEGIEPCIGVTTTAIKDTLNDSQPIPVTIEKILNEVARTYNVMPSDIRGKKRNANVSAARQMTMYIIREVTGMSMEAIGQEFQRDHSTVVYSIKTMEENIKRDQHLKEMCSDIMKNVRT